MMQPKSNPVIIKKYNPNWPDEFEKSRDNLITTLGTVAMRGDPIGSTSVVGFAAKPIIEF